MASATIDIPIQISPDDKTMKLILAMLNIWQDSHPDQMVAMVPAKDKYQYEIIDMKKGENRIDPEGVR